jgi:uncharacterized protein YggU (UPF0235/DUF167 family)
MHHRHSSYAATKELGVPRSSIEIVGGETSRHKRLALPLSEAELGVRLPAR